MNRFSQTSNPYTHPEAMAVNRRKFVTQAGLGLGTIALADLLGDRATAGAAVTDRPVLQRLHHPPKAKRVIFLFQSGGPSHLDLYDPKPLLKELHGSELPDEVRGGQRLTSMSGNQASIPLVASPFAFKPHGQSGIEVSEAVPHIASIVDDISLIRSMHTEAINHGPAVTYVQTGSQFPGRPSMGAWLSYGLGTENSNLPAFVVMVTKNKGGQPLVSRLWGSGFLPSRHQGVRFRSGKEPVLYLNNPDGLNAESRRVMLDSLEQLHQHQLAANPDPMVETRIAQHELAFRMQASIPEATDLSDEPNYVFDEYGESAREPGTFAANCVLARRLAERGVRFIQLYHPGWDHHGNVPGGIRGQTKETDQPSAALVKDLKRRGMLDDTLVIWAGEFGRTSYCQGKLKKSFGRDHHGRCFSLWMAGGGVRGGTVHGATDDFGYNVADNGVHIHDLQATILHLMGIDHERLTFRYQGRRFRLTDVHGQLVRPVIA